MDPSTAKIPLLVILGPTAVGKTEISILVAERMKGEIVSADSRLVYRGMDIGTCKPSLEEREKIPHHLIDIITPSETWSLALFQNSARKAICSVRERERIPILVGGTGQYIHALTRGWSPPEIPPDPAIRAELEARAEIEGSMALYNELEQLDPAAARLIDARNLRRTIRALEVIRLTGKLFSSQRQITTNPYGIVSMGITRSRLDLYQRIDMRIESMFTTGLLMEVKTLLDAGYSPDLPSMSSIGYQECAAVHHGIISLEKAKELMRRRTRIYVRRQANWFKLSDPDIHWVQSDGRSNEEIADEICSTFLQIDGESRSEL